MSTKPTWLIFDLGGVVVDIDFKSVLQEFCKTANVSIEEATKLFIDRCTHGLEEFNLTEGYQKGEITCDEFLDGIVFHSNNQFDRASARVLWNNILVREKQDTLELIKQFKSHYNLAIYSNTNQIHCEYMREHYQFFSEFQEVYLSHEVGLIKPDPAVFDFIAQDLQAKPEQCVFIDDTLPNIEAALNKDFQAVHFKNAKDLHFLLENVGA